MKKYLYIITFICISNSTFAGVALLDHYQSTPLSGWYNNNLNVCGSTTKDLRLYYTYCPGFGTNCAPANSCFGNPNYRFLVTLEKNGLWVDDHTFDGGYWTYDYFYAVNMTPGSYRIKVVFQKRNLTCQYVTLETTYSNTIVVTGLPNISPVSITGPNVICTTNSQSYTLSGTSVNTTYTFNSTNNTFKLNGSNTWPINITGINPTIQIQPIVSGSSTTLSVTTSSSGYCGTSNSSIQISSLNPLLTVIASPTCTGPGGTTTVTATPNYSISNPTYGWQKKLSSAAWPTNDINTGSNPTYNLSVVTTPTVDISYDFRARVTDQGCVSPYSTSVRVRWCKDNGVYCCIPKREGEFEEEQLENKITISPNPSNGNLFVKFSESTFEIKKLLVSDLSGRIVKVVDPKTNSAELNINFDEFSNGCYLLQVIDQGNTIYNSKFILSR